VGGEGDTYSVGSLRKNYSQSLDLRITCILRPVTGVSFFYGTQGGMCLPPLTWGRKKIRVSESLCFLVFRIPDNGHNCINSVILSVIHHRQKPLYSTRDLISLLLPFVLIQRSWIKSFCPNIYTLHILHQKSVLSQDAYSLWKTHDTSELRTQNSLVRGSAGSIGLAGTHYRPIICFV
jgi:hypothetical protein